MEGPGVSVYYLYVLCSVTLGFPFFEGVARAFSVIVACGRVCVSLTAKLLCAVWMCICLSLSWDWTKEMEHTMARSQNHPIT
jgi:hypothetical protein